MIPREIEEFIEMYWKRIRGLNIKIKSNIYLKNIEIFYKGQNSNK